jgi:hypothetical protein
MPSATSSVAIGKWNLDANGAIPMGAGAPEESRVWDERLAQLRGFGTLTEDWDSEGSSPPDVRVVDAAISLAQELKANGFSPADRVIVGVNRTIFFEWHSPSRYAEIEVTAPDSVEFLAVDKATGMTTASVFNQCGS